MKLATTFLAALVASTSLAPQTADACGGDYNPAPAMFVVAEHHGRVFVLLGGAVPEGEKLGWWRDDMSYDRTEIAKAPALAGAMELTLVGEKKTRVMTTKNQVFIKPVFEARNAMTALEVFPPANQPVRIAIAGKHTTAWQDVTYQEKPGLETIAWAQNPGFTPALDPSYLTVSKVVGSDLEMITAYNGVGGMTTYFRSAGVKPWGGYRGSPIGAVTVDGARYIVLVQDGIVTPIRA